MLKIRHRDGKTTDLQDGCFIEMVNRDGQLGSVWFQDGPRIMRIRPGSSEALSYSRLFGSKFVEQELVVDL